SAGGVLPHAAAEVAAVRADRFGIVPIAAIALGMGAIGGCRRGGDASRASPGDGGAAETIERTAESGPVKAVVTLSPAKPTLGDTLHLLLKVTAHKGVEVRMPTFGEALGRFSITAF